MPRVCKEVCGRLDLDNPAQVYGLRAALSVKCSLRNIDLAVRLGEIVGWAGIQGAGRVALALALFGEIPFEHDAVTLNGASVAFQTPRSAILGGIGLLRKSEGLMTSVRDNGMLTSRGFTPFRPGDR